MRRLNAFFIIFSFIPGTLFAEIAEDCLQLFNAKIKNKIGKEDCVVTCLALKVDMSNFQCAIAPYYCEEYCKSCRYPLLIRFDGTSLSVVKDCKNIIGRWRAVSGREESSGRRWVAWRGGSLPEGLYRIFPKEITTPSLIRRPIFWFAQRNWGKYRVPLHADKITKTYGRSGFFIHGGVSFGSEGCIDLDDDEVPFFEWLKKQKESLPVEVKYEH